MPGRRSVSVEPEDLVIASPRRRSARIAIRTDSPAPALKKELAPEKSSTPAKRTRRSLSIQEKSLNDIEKDVNAISHHLKSRTASSSNVSEQITGAARRTRRSASTQETHVLPDDLKKDDKPMPLKRSKRLLSKENSTDVIAEEDNKPEPTDDELNATSTRKRLTRSMSRSPTNAQKSKTSVPPVVKTFRNRLSTSDKNLEEIKPTVLDIITENEDEADKNENNTNKPTLETDMLNNNAKKVSDDINMQIDETTEDSAGKSALPAVSAGDEVIKSAGTKSEVQSSQLMLKNEETVLNTSVKSTTVEETYITLNSTNNMDIADKSVTENLLPNNDQNALNEKMTESIIMATSPAENMKISESSNKLDDSIKETVCIEGDINVSIKELNDGNNCEFPLNESESKKDSTLNKTHSVLGKEDNSDLKVDTEIIDDSDPKKKEENVITDEHENDNKIDNTEETIDKLEITQEEMMDKLEINEESEECKDHISISEKSIIGTMSTSTNQNNDKSKVMECTVSVKNNNREENYALNETPTEISNATVENITKGEKETSKIVFEIEVTQNKVNILELVEGNKDPGNENSKQIEVADVILPEQNNSTNSIKELDVVEVHSCEEQTNLIAKEQSETLDNSVAEQRIDTEVSPRKINENLELTSELEVNNEPVNKDDSISSNVTTEIQDTVNDKTTNDDDVTNISIVSADKTHTTVDKCDNEENCETNISIVDSPDSNISSTPIKDTRIEKSDSAKKEHERNLNLSLVNDDGKSYSPIINRIENISVDFEYSTSSIVDSSGTALQEIDNEANATEDDVELVTKDSCLEQCETSFQNQKKSENLNKSNNEIPKEAKISYESFQSEEKELNNSIKEVNQNDDSSNENIKEDDILNRSKKVNKNDNSSNENIKKDEIINKSNRNRKNMVLDTSSDENIDSNEEIEKIDLTKSESPEKEINESITTKTKVSDMESTEKSKDKLLDDFIECFKAEKKRKSNLKRQSSDDSIAESALKQKKRRKHKTELNFSSESDENSDIGKSESAIRNRNKHNISDESEDEESDEYERNEFMDDMASEGSEETPSIDSNEIIDEGESVGSTDSQIDSDDDYEHGSFVVDDDVGNEDLLSGSEDGECWTPKRKRIITIASDTDDELDKMSMEPFGGSSPSLISINQISSVDSDLESIKCKNEELSKLIEDKTKSDTEDVDNEDVVIVNESINKSESHAVLKNKSNIEELSESLSKHTAENIETIGKIQQPEEELKDAISITGDTVNVLEESSSSLTEPMNELNTVDEKENLVETIENPDISQEQIVEKKSVDKSSNEKEIIEEVIEPEEAICNETENNVERESDNINSENTQEIQNKEKDARYKEVIEPEEAICNEVENNVERESDNINSENTQEIQNKEKDARYKAILDKYFKHFDDKISKSTRRRTIGMFSIENNDDANKDTTTKRKRRQSLDTGEKKSQNDIGTDMFEDFYNQSKKAKIPINDDDHEEKMIDIKKEETEPKKTNSKVKKRTTDENDQGGISDAVEQKCKKTLKSVKRHSLTNIENIPGKYVQSPRQLSKSFTGYSTPKEIEIIQKYIEIDNTESAACMLKDFSDTVKDDIKAAKAYILSPKKKKSRKSFDSSELNESGILVESPSGPNNTSDLEINKPSPKKPLLATSPAEKDCGTLKRKKKHSKSVDTLIQEELTASEIIDTKEIEEVYTKTKKKKKQIKLETNDTNHCNEQADKDNLEINVTTKKQTKNTGNFKKSKQCIKLPTTASVSEINVQEAGNEIKQKYKHSNFSKNNAKTSVDVTSYSSAVPENTEVKLIDQKNMNNKKPKQITTSKSLPKNKNKNRSSPDNKFVIKKEHSIASKSEYDVVNEFVSRNINIYKNLIRPSGRGTTGGNMKVENLHAASIKIKKEKKKQKYNRSGKADAPVPKASFTGQANCSNFKEEFLFGNNVKRVAVSDILQKKRSVK